MTSWYPARVLVEQGVVDAPLTREVLSRCRNAKVIPFESVAGETDRELLRRLFARPGAADTTRVASLARSSLLLLDSSEVFQTMTANAVFERRCHNFYKILPYTGVCRADCAYCWFKDPVLIPKVNVRFFDRLPHLLGRMADRTDRPTVFTFTHYKTDCFALEHLTGFVRRTARYFERQSQFYVQFLTKLAAVDCLLNPAPTRGTHVCFSVNASEVARAVELGASSVEARLHAGRKLADAGIPVMLRVDPMLAIDGWESAYVRLVDQIFEQFMPVHITIGTPRYQSLEELEIVLSHTRGKRAREIIREQAARMTANKPGAPMTTIAGEQSYYFKNMPVSYPTELRMQMYRLMVDRCRYYVAGLSLGLCEEPAEVWDACCVPWRGDPACDCSCNFVPASLSEIYWHTREKDG